MFFVACVNECVMPAATWQWETGSDHLFHPTKLEMQAGLVIKVLLLNQIGGWMGLAKPSGKNAWVSRCKTRVFGWVAVTGAGEWSSGMLAIPCGVVPIPGGTSRRPR